MGLMMHRAIIEYKYRYGEGWDQDRVHFPSLLQGTLLSFCQWCLFILTPDTFCVS